MNFGVGRGQAASPLLRAHLWMFPPTCRQCGRLLAPPGRAAGSDPAPAGYPFLCGACRERLPWWPEAQWGDPAPAGVARVWAACRYDDPIDTWIQHLKYERRDALVRLLAAVLDDAPAVRDAGEDVHLLVPVPLHPWRLWQRGFNQSLLLAHAWRRRVRARPRCEAAGQALRLAPGLLVRHRHTRPQVSVSGAERHSNVADAFSLHPRLARQPAPLRGRRVLLFDDVTTTGATLAACALALLAAGAERVDALVLARAWRSAAGPPGAPASQPAPEPLP